MLYLVREYPIVFYKVEELASGGEVWHLEIPDIQFHTKLLGTEVEVYALARVVLVEYRNTFNRLPKPTKWIKVAKGHSLGGVKTSVADFYDDSWWGLLKYRIGKSRISLKKLSTLVAVGGLFSLAVLFWNFVNQKSPEFWFYTGKSGQYHFQWVGISVLLAVVGLFVNNIWDRKKMNADIRSKSRIDWMKTVRDSISDYEEKLLNWAQLSQGFLNSYIPKLASNQLLTTNEVSLWRSEFEDQMIEASVSVQKSRDRLKLYIPESLDNTLVINGLNAVENAHFSFQSRFETMRGMADEILFQGTSDDKERMIEGIQIFNHDGLRGLELAWEQMNARGKLYFKSEWEKAKRGK